MSNRKFAGTLLLYSFFILIIIIDIFIIWDLATSLMGRNFLVTISTSMIFVAGIDLLPIFGLTPALNKIVKGVVTEERSGYWVTIFIIVLSLVMFLSLASIYYYMSVNYPERFISVTDNTIGNVINQAVSGVSAISEDDAERTMRTAEVAAQAAGMLPFITTVISCFFNYLSIGDKCIDDEIKKMERLKSMHNKALQKCVQTDVFLQNLREHLAVIHNYISGYESKVKTYMPKSELDEKNANEHASEQIKRWIYDELDTLERNGRKSIKENFSNNPNINVNEKLHNWGLFWGYTKDEIEKELNKPTP